MTKNTKRKLYYQKYLPGDIITWSYDSNEIILIKNWCSRIIWKF